MPIEVQRRELDAKLVVSTLAAQRGYKILIGRDRIVRRLARFLPKGILFDKSIGGKGDKKVYRYNRLGYRIAAMDEEGTGFLVDPDMFLEARMADDTLALTSRWFCISDAVRDMCLERFPKHSEKFVTTGLGRTDTWRRPLLGLYDELAQNIRDKYGRFILFNSNFGLVNHARGKEFVSKQMRKVEAMYDAEAANYAQQVEENQANLDCYIEVLPKILTWLPEHNIVVRPHPAENVDFWKETFKHEPRIFVEDEGVVTSWIVASEFMLHHGCTTGIEAEIMGHPQVNYAPMPDMCHDTDMARTFSRFVHTEQELRQTITDAVINGNSERMPLAGQGTFFASLEGRLVAEKIVDEFDKIAFGSGDLSKMLPLLRFSPRHLVSAFKDVTTKAKAYSNQKFSGVTVDELTDKLDFISGALDVPNKTSVTEVFENLYCIETNDR